MQNILLYLSCCLSCFIVITILFGFMDGRYHRINQKRYVYVIIEIIVVLAIALINMLEHAFLNFVVWVLFVGACSLFLYYEDYDRPIKRLLESEVLIFLIAICESLGVVLADWILKCLHIEGQTYIMKTCIETAFSKVILIFLYYMAVNRLLKKRVAYFTRQQYVFNSVIILCFLVDIIVIADNMAHRPDNNYFLVLNLGCIVLAALYLLYFVKIMNENKSLEYEVHLLEKQAEMQYKYYKRQEKEYNKTIRVLHDVNKHIKTIEQLSLNGYSEDVEIYTKQIGGKLKTLIPVQYTGNPILDILLTDRKTIMEEKEIDFCIKVDNVNLDFIDSIDITTIFGNILDNAVEACENIEGNRKIAIEIGSYHEMISIRVENTCASAVKWKNGHPVSEKGKNHGIGLLNVQHSIEKYDGNMQLRENNGVFIVDIFLNS